VAISAVLLALGGAVLGLAFAGSPARIAEGVRVAGVDVGGLRPDEARRLLERRFAAVEGVPVLFRAAGRSWRLSPRQLGVRVDWRAAVGDARRQGDGVGPFRGFRRLDVRFFGADLVPPAQAYANGLRFVLDRIGRDVRRPRREGAVELRGLRAVVVRGRPGIALDRRAAAGAIVRALAGFARNPVALPVRVDRPRISPADLAPARAEAQTAVSTPVRLVLGETRWRISRPGVARLLDLPAAGRRALRIGGPGADRFFAALQRRVGRPPQDADFSVLGDRVAVVPSRPGVRLDVVRSARALLAAVRSPRARTARLVAEKEQPERSTAEARGMGIVERVSSFTTIYGGDPNRIHNVQLVAHLVDRHLIAPGATFSFNQATGERSAEKGFLEAPVIINGELQTGLGGGVCQVSTTVFNAAYEAGLPIAARTNHALYISHYPQGRDATVNYPDVDLRFVNDTGHWLLVRTFVGASSLTVGLYGTSTGRRVVSTTAPLVTTTTPPLKRVPDPALQAGTSVLEDSGEPARATSVHRVVYSASGRVLSDATFSSSYRSEPRLGRYGTKPKPKPRPEPTETTTTGTTTTGTTETAPTPGSGKPKPPPTTTASTP
jgi:vancomycin resistance protein YoaR